MMTLSSHQLASINKIQFRFCDPDLGKKYNVDTISSFLFDVAEPKAPRIDADAMSIVSVPQDVMFRVRKTLLSLLHFECTDPVERQLLYKWCDEFIFMDSRGKAMRHSNHVLESISEAVRAKEATFCIIIDSSACSKTPMGATAATAVATPPTTLSTPARRSPRRVSDASTSSGGGRPPLAPRNNVISPATKEGIMQKSPVKMVDALKKPFSIPFAFDHIEKDDGLSFSKTSVSSSKTTLTAMMDIENDAADVDGNEENPQDDYDPIPVEYPCDMETQEDKSFNLDALIEDCVGDVLALAAPDDVLPFLLLNDDDGLLPSVMEYELTRSSPVKKRFDLFKDDDGSSSTHCFLLPFFFDESTSLMATTGNTCMDDSSLFNEHERDMVSILQSVMEIVEETIVEVTEA